MKLNYRHTLYACCVGYITQAIVNNFLPLMFVLLNTSYGISTGRLGLLVTINFVIQMVVDYLSAKYTEKIGYRRLVVFAHISSALGLVLLGLAPMIAPDNIYAVIILSIVLYAVGGGIIEVLISPMVEALPMDNKAGTMSFLHSFYCWGHVGVVLVSTLAFTIFGIENWYWLSMVWAIIPALNAFAFAKLPIYIFGEEQGSEKVGNLFKNKLFWLFIVLMLCAGASELTMSQWASYFTEIGLGVSKTMCDLLGPCSFAVFMGISRVVYGKISHRVEVSKFIIVSGALCVFSYVLTTLSPIPVLSVIGCALCGFSVGIMWPGVLSLAAKNCAKGGTAMFAFLALAGDVGCSTGPTIAGYVSQALGSTDFAIKMGLLGIAVFPIIMIFSILILKKVKL